MPKALVFPNYDIVLLGKDQSLEGGAFIARTGDASANFYNPAGLVQSEKTSLNASSAGWVWTSLASEGGSNSITTLRIDNVPGYFGVVIGNPIIGSRNLRFGASITRLVAWSPGGIDQSVAPTAANGIDRITYSASSSFSTQLYQGSVAWAPVQSLRLGLSAGLANTSFGSTATLSGLLTGADQPGQFLSTLRAYGNEWDGIVGAGLQWDVLAGLTMGFTVRSPGLRMSAGSLVTYESASVTPQSPTTSFLRDEGGHFEYKQTLQTSLGIAYRFGGAQIETDLRYHAGTGSYEFYRPNSLLQVTSQNPAGGATTTTQPLSPIRYDASPVWNVSVGGNVKLGGIATLHGGFYTSFSPVADPDSSPFRSADLYGLTGGLDFRFEHFGFSLGAGYQFGTSHHTSISLGNGAQAGITGVSMRALSLLYAISYSF